MPLNWDDDDEEELTELDYPKRSSRVIIHEEITAPSGDRTPLPQYPPARSTPAYPPQTTQAAQTYAQPGPTAKTLGLVPAPSRDRFVAFVLDSLVGFYIYWLVGFGLNIFFETPNFKILHASSGRYGIHLAITLIAFLFYYLLMESVFGATLGKLFCRLHVIEENGRRPSLGNIFIRNFLRIVDYQIFFLIAVISMESSPSNQRLGDRAAKTIVIKKTRRYVPAVDLQHTPLASTLSRLMAEFIDLIFSLTLVYSLILLMSVNKPVLSYILLISTPVAFIAYYTLLEFLTGTTPGKAIFLRQVVMDNGEPPDGTAAFIRNLFRPLDYIIGYPLMVLSKRKQRLGDMAGDTLVVAKGTDQKGILGSLMAIGLIILIAYFGFNNPNNFIRKDYGLGPIQGLKIFFRPVSGFFKGTSIQRTTPKTKKPVKKADVEKTSPIQPKNLPATTSDKLNLAEFYFATGPEPSQIRHDRKFRPGDSIYVFFKVEGFESNPEKDASLSEDLNVEGPKGKIVLSEPQIVQLTKPIDEKSKAILFANNIKLPKDTAKGEYRVIFTVYDHVADTQFSFEKKFNLQ